ncbi:MAG: hypothetical protein ACFFDF_24910 [Candidatus Odinarchaeota archaeon]
MNIQKIRIEDYNKMELANLKYNYQKLLNYSEKENKKWIRYWANIICDHFFAILDLYERAGLKYTFLDMLHRTKVPQILIKQAEFFIFNTKEWVTTEELVDVLNDILND